jgi:hypothetical protein
VDNVWPKENNQNDGYDHGSRGVRFVFSGCTAAEVTLYPIAIDL